MLISQDETLCSSCPSGSGSRLLAVKPSSLSLAFSSLHLCSCFWYLFLSILSPLASFLGCSVPSHATVMNVERKGTQSQITSIYKTTHSEITITNKTLPSTKMFKKNLHILCFFCVKFFHAFDITKWTSASKISVLCGVLNIHHNPYYTYSCIHTLTYTLKKTVIKGKHNKSLKLRELKKVAELHLKYATVVKSTSNPAPAAKGTARSMDLHRDQLIGETAA